MNIPKIPAGYRQDAQGRLVPEESIKQIDLDRDALVTAILAQAQERSGELAAFRTAVLEQVDRFVTASAERYKVKLGGKKGNLTLVSFDGRFKVIVAQSETLVFDERLLAAKELIDQCIRGWSEGASTELLALVNDAFRVDQAGKLSTGRILGLRRLNIEDRKWKKAMEAISESVQVASSKRYIRFYIRLEDSEEYVPVSLDVASA
jgi:hypothetical protein